MATTAHTNVSKSTNIEENTSKIDSLRGGDFDMEAIEKEAAVVAAYQLQDVHFSGSGDQKFGKLTTKELLAQTRQLDLKNESSSPERLESSPGRLSLISATDEQ